MRLVKKFVFIICLFLLILIMYEKYILKKPIIKILGNSFLIVTTGSMEPTIKKEELIIIHEEKEYKENDIVTFIDDNGLLVTHRIIKIQEEKFISKGDLNNIEDPINNIKNIQGKVIFHSKVIGIFVLYILKPLVVCYICIICIIEITKKEKKT